MPADDDRPMSDPAARRWAAALLVGYTVVALGSVANKSVTFDEIAHLTAGTAYWRHNDYRLQPENGNLPQRWCALPVVLTGCAALPPPDHPGWATSDVWALADAYLHQLGNPLERMLFRGRAAAVVWGVLAGALVFAWSRRLWGNAGGLISLAACVTCPTMLAHGPLMTSDMCAAFFFLAAVGAVWRALHRVDAIGLAALAAATAGLFLAKSSALLVLPMAALLVAVRLARREPLALAWRGRTREVRSRWRVLLAAAGVAAVTAVAVWGAVWAAYGGRYTACAPGPLPPGEFFKFLSLDGVRGKLPPGPTEAAVRVLGELRALPEAWLYGTAYVVAHRRRAAFFLGEYSLDGWAGYFPYAFLVKTAWPLFALLGLSLAAVVTGRRPSPVTTADEPPRPPLWYRTAPLWTLLGVYWAVSLVTSLNIGHRHLLPTYLPLYVLVGGAAGWLVVPAGQWAVGGALAWSAAVAAFAFPHYLSYFNPLVRRDRAYEVLADSNIDWGQDLPGLRDWLALHNPPGPRQLPVYLAYFGTGSPEAYRIDAVRLPPPPDPGVPFDWQPGLYCVSATTLSGVYAGGRWTAEWEQAHSELAAYMSRYAGMPADELRKELGANADRHPGLVMMYRGLRYLRLLAYLRHRPPDDHVGYSILVFRLTAADLSEAFAGPPRERADRPSFSAPDAP